MFTNCFPYVKKKYKKLPENEVTRTVDGTVHMGFGGEGHHVRQLELGEHPVELVAVADVDLLELEPVRLRDGRQILDIAGVGELVDHADRVRRVVDDMPGHGGPDEAGSAGDDNTVHRKRIIPQCMEKNLEWVPNPDCICAQEGEPNRNSVLYFHEEKQ